MNCTTETNNVKARVTYENLNFKLALETERQEGEKMTKKKVSRKDTRTETGKSKVCPSVPPVTTIPGAVPPVGTKVVGLDTSDIVN